ncbi:unnamed protein product [Sphagnum troendelagicum]|uniref:GIL1/IRKI C-terminal domain-containing protein n=1 Tax=Sphagnum troendelagicum TaxID=128251 RepID=A0ABP0V082_9BRYO
MVQSSVSEDDGGGGRRGGEEEEQRQQEEEEEEEEEENEGANEITRKKATREQVAAMRRESVALRAQVAAALVHQQQAEAGGTAAAAADPRAARRREYPVFTLSYGDDPKQQQLMTSTAAGGSKLKYCGSLQTTKQQQQQQQQQITSAQIWQQQLHHDHSAQQFGLDYEQQQQFMAQDHHITPGNSFRSHELPAQIMRSSRMISPLPATPLTGLTPNGKQQLQHLNRSSASSPKSANLEKYRHCDAAAPVSPISMYSGMEINNLQDLKMMMMMGNTTASTTTLGGRSRRSPGTMSSIESGSKIHTPTAMVGLARDIGSRGKMIAAAAGGSSSSTTAAALPTTSSAWHNCAGGLSSVVPVAGTASLYDSGPIIDPPETPLPQPLVEVALKQPPSPQPNSSSSGYFNFLVWGSKKKGLLKKMGHGTATSESGSIISNSNNTEQEKIVNLENKTKMLELKLEESNKKRAAAVYEIRALRLAMEILDGNIKQLQAECQELQQQRFQDSQMMKKDLELELDDENDEDMIGTESTTAAPSVWTTAHIGHSSSSHHPRVTPELFLTTFENAKRSLRKLTDVICHHIRELGGSFTHVIACLLEQHKVGNNKPASQMPRLMKLLYFEAFLNQIMFESFENVNFESNGATAIFNQEALQEASFQSFLDLKKQNWPDIEKALSKAQGVIVNTTFHRFFVVRMEIVISQLGKLGETNMPVSVITAFYKAVKAVWLVHHLAFAFGPAAVTIFRIAPGSKFNPMYMEEVVVAPLSANSNKQVINSGPPYVSIMVSPGFIVDKEVCKCKVLCSSKPKPLT